MDPITLGLAKKYVDDTANSLGAVKGSPATIESITPVDGGNNVVFAWTGTDGTKQTQMMFVADGKDVCGITKTEKKLILTLLDNVAYVTDDMSETLAQLRELWDGADEPEGELVYKWVVGLNGTGNPEAIMSRDVENRAMALAENTGIPLYYASPREVSPYSPVVIPDGAVSVTVKCQGFRVGFNELKLVDGKWHRLFNSDSNPVADEATYAFRNTEAGALFVKLRPITDDATTLTNVPEVADIVFNY